MSFINNLVPVVLAIFSYEVGKWVYEKFKSRSIEEITVLTSVEVAKKLEDVELSKKIIQDLRDKLCKEKIKLPKVHFMDVPFLKENFILIQIKGPAYVIDLEEVLGISVIGELLPTEVLQVISNTIYTSMKEKKYNAK